MKKYAVIDRGARVAPGNKVMLNADQYRRRKHNLKVIDEDKSIYLVVNKIEFKLGETFSTDCDMNLKVGKIIDEEMKAKIEADKKGEAKEKPKKESKKQKKAQLKSEKESAAKSEEDLLNVLD